MMTNGMDNVIIRFEFTSIVPIHQHQIANMSMNVTQRKQISFQNSNPWPELDEFNSKLGDCQSSEKKNTFQIWLYENAFECEKRSIWMQIFKQNFWYFWLLSKYNGVNLVVESFFVCLDGEFFLLYVNFETKCGILFMKGKRLLEVKSNGEKVGGYVTVWVVSNWMLLCVCDVFGGWLFLSVSRDKLEVKWFPAWELVDWQAKLNFSQKRYREREKESWEWVGCRHHFSWKLHANQIGGKRNGSKINQISD